MYFLAMYPTTASCVVSKKSKLEQKVDYKTDLYILFYSDIILKSKIAFCLLNCPLKLGDVQFSTCQSPKVRYKFIDTKNSYLCHASYCL